MTSEQLYNLVRDVRADLWPRNIAIGGVEGRRWFYNRMVGAHTEVYDDHVELMFVGSMAAEVVKRGGAIGEHPMESGVVVVLGGKRYAAPTLIAALAAALKEVQ